MVLFSYPLKYCICSMHNTVASACIQSTCEREHNMSASCAKSHRSSHMTRNKKVCNGKQKKNKRNTIELRKVEQTRRLSSVSKGFRNLLTAKSLFSYQLPPGHISVWSFLPHPLSRGGILTGGHALWTMAYNINMSIYHLIKLTTNSNQAQNNPN